MWFRVCDTLYDHPKFYDASDAAVALWVRAGSWCMRNLTDGRVPAGMVARLGSEEAAAELVKRGLWRRVRGGGYRFHDWAQYQPTRAQVEADRKSARLRQERWRNRQAAGQTGAPVRPWRPPADDRAMKLYGPPPDARGA